jgi:hypothetical protein
MKVLQVMSGIIDMWSPSSSFFILFFHIIIAPRIYNVELNQVLH